MKQRTRRRCSHLAVSAVVFFGCSVQGLTGGPPEEALQSQDAGEQDVGLGPETAAPSDSGFDATDEGRDAAPASWCGASSATFCADFDRKPLPGEFSFQDGTFLSLSSATRKSEPQSLQINVPAQGGSSGFASRLRQSFTQTVSMLSLSFDVWPEKVNTDGALAGLLVTEISFATGGGKYAIRLAFAQGKARFEEFQSGLADVHHDFFNVPAKVWTRMSIDITIGQGTGKYVHKMDGVQVGDEQPLRVPATLDLNPTLEFGAVFGTNPQNGWILYADNLTFDLR